MCWIRLHSPLSVVDLSQSGGFNGLARTREIVPFTMKLHKFKAIIRQRCYWGCICCSRFCGAPKKDNVGEKARMELMCSFMQNVSCVNIVKKMTCCCQSLTVLSLELNLPHFSVLFTVTFFIVPPTPPPWKKKCVTLCWCPSLQKMERTYHQKWTVLLWDPNILWYTPLFVFHPVRSTL